MYPEIKPRAPSILTVTKHNVQLLCTDIKSYELSKIMNVIFYERTEQLYI